MVELAGGGPESAPSVPAPDGATFAQLALTWAVADAVGRAGRRRLVARLSGIEAAWRAGARAGPAQAVSAAELAAAAAFIGPAIALIRQAFPDG